VLQVATVGSVLIGALRLRARDEPVARESPSRRRAGGVHVDVQDAGAASS
jgi:hypothetical protein